MSEDKLSRQDALAWLDQRCGGSVSVRFLNTSGRSLGPTDAEGILSRDPDQTDLYCVGSAPVDLGDADLPVEYGLQHEEAERDCLAIVLAEGVEFQFWSADRPPRVWDLNEVVAELRARGGRRLMARQRERARGRQVDHRQVVARGVSAGRVNGMSTNVAGQVRTDNHARCSWGPEYPANPTLSATDQKGPAQREENQLF